MALTVGTTVKIIADDLCTKCNSVVNVINGKVYSLEVLPYLVLFSIFGDPIDKQSTFYL